MLMALMSANAKGQIYAYDEAARLPTKDLYDTNIMLASLHAYAETYEARRREYEERKDLFSNYYELALKSYNNNSWNYAIIYSDKAFSTGFYNGTLYYIRGYAYEKSGNYKQAKKDYKKGIKYDSEDAAIALQALKEKLKRK